MRAIKLLLLIITPSFTFGQLKYSDCKCPVSQFSANTKADTIYHLSNNYTIALCGYGDTGLIKGKLLYREFVLSVCGSDKIVKFWDAMHICNLKVSADTLIVETMVELPVGKAMNDEWTAWTLEHIYFVNNSVRRDSVINPRFPKYNQSQIADVLNLYKVTPDANNDTTEKLEDKLFVSALSNSKEAAYYLVNFRKKYTHLDGVYLEDYDRIIRMYDLYKREK
jgi:hypothetical protein